MWAWLGFDPPIERQRARALAGAAAQASRTPALYGPKRVDDTFSGRFEMAALHAILLMRRIAAEPDGRRLAQAVSNRVFSSFDEALREVGEGDLSVAKRMKSLARAFYGRLQAYETGLATADEAALAAALARNVWNLDTAPFAPKLATYAVALDRALAGTPLAELGDGRPWPQTAASTL